MKVIAAVEADFERGPLGTRSRLSEELVGETVLRRTLRQVLAARRVQRVHLVTGSQHASLAHQAAVGLNVAVELHDAGAVPWRAVVASSRKWSLDAWRGGIGGSTLLDEELNPWVLEALARREQADLVVSVPAAACLLDPELLDRMIGHFETVREDARLVFTQSAPGLSAVLLSPGFLEDVVKVCQPAGRPLAYRPSDPRSDMISRSCFFPTDAIVAHAVGRCLADTTAGWERLQDILSETGALEDLPLQKSNGSLSAESVSKWLAGNRHKLRPLPAEVEVELTTQDPLPASTLRPRGAAVPAREPMDMDVFRRLVDELAARDDTRMVLGGFGDPLLYPDLAGCLRHCRQAGIFGIAVRTSAVHLEDAAVNALLETGVDVLSVLLDAATPETYRKVHGADCYERVVGNIDRLLDIQQARPESNGLPLVVCEMVKTGDTLAEMEVFYDQWLSRTGGAVLAGPSTYGGQWPDLSVMNMAPPTRGPCLRLFSRAMVLADGRVTACDQDFRGQQAIGSLREQTLGQLWQSQGMQRIRTSHLCGEYDALPLCAACTEWHRP